MNHHKFCQTFWCFAFISSQFIIPTTQDEEPPMCRGSRGDRMLDGVHDESIFLLEEVRRDQHYSESKGQLVAFLSGQKDCPEIAKVNVSTCPTYYTMNYDPSRRPPMVVEAKCSCKKCLSDIGTTTGRCAPIYYYRYVKELVQRLSGQCFQRAVRRFSAGCECIGDTRDSSGSSVSGM